MYVCAVTHLRANLCWKGRETETFPSDFSWTGMQIYTLGGGKQGMKEAVLRTEGKEKICSSHVYLSVNLWGRTENL